MRPSNAGGKRLQQRRLQLAASASGSGSVGRVASRHDHVGADIGGQQDQRVLEIDAPPGAVFHHALVEDLEEDLVHVGVRLLDLVEQNDAIGTLAARLR